MHDYFWPLLIFKVSRGMNASTTLLKEALVQTLAQSIHSALQPCNPLLSSNSEHSSNNLKISNNVSGAICPEHITTEIYQEILAWIYTSHEKT
jgi:hypothetical protein